MPKRAQCIACGIGLLVCLQAAAAGAFPNVVDLNGHRLDPFAVSDGKMTVLIFIRTDCPISNRYAPTIQDLAHRYEARARFWLVYPGRVQTNADIERQTTDYGYHLPVARDLAGELTKLSEVQTTPEVAVFNAANKLIYHGRIDNWFEGFGRARTSPTTHELEDALKAGMTGKLPAVSMAPAVGCSIADLQ